MLESDGLVDLVPLDIERGRRAATIAAATGVRGADAVYLELAVQRGEVLVTWDRQQLDGDARVARVQRPAA
jgi:predicted nucleic acid-binding protein